MTEMTDQSGQGCIVVGVDAWAASEEALLWAAPPRCSLLAAAGTEPSSACCWARSASTA